MTYPEIHIWGDSLARGIVYREEKERYAISKDRCTSRLQEVLGCKVENHSNMGATVLDGLSLFEHFTPVPGALCAVEFGGNDCDLDWAYVAAHPGEPVRAKVALPEFEEGLRRFVQEIRGRGMQPLLVTPLPLHAERYFRWVTRGLDAEAVLQALGEVQSIYHWQERYTIAMRRAAHATSCPLLDLRDTMLARQDYAQLMCLDGIHPNDGGHKLLADVVVELAKRSLPEAGAQAQAAPAAIWSTPQAN
ncbi:MAG: SGNH/GDSL hydrolase family protein [Candidatus Limiplasma sp.]|nr:SGNH/GDSL hydrolase family protein [Candidatus Limiplasma sp.]